MVISGLLLACTIPPWSAHAAQNGNKLSTKTYKQVQASAKTGHKKIFVDAYATWCIPCKQLQMATFKDVNVAAYYNKNFMNFKIDV